MSACRLLACQLVCLLACLLACVSVASATDLTFQYKPVLSYRRTTEPCKICYGDDCMQIDQDRCEYYIETDLILRDEEQREEDNPVIKSEVDRLLYAFMENATAQQTECLPFVSQYTNCTKENICIGCKTCSCNADGKWNCTITNKCRPEVPADIDHRVLVTVMENLPSGAKYYNRMKREARKANTKRNKLSYEEISRWMYGVDVITSKEPDIIHANTDDEIQATAAPTETTTQEAIHNLKPDTSPDYIAFDEVLNDIAVDTQNYTRRKPLIHNDSIAFDYMLFEEDIPKNVTDNAEVENIENNYISTDTGVGETDVVIDLLASAKKNEGKTFTANWTDYTETDGKMNLIDPALDYLDNFILGSKNIMKRDIVQIRNDTEQPNLNDNVKELRNNVLLPLSNIINDKQKELEDLLRVSENLINIMRSYNNQSAKADLTEMKNEEHTNTSVSIYNFEIAPEIDSVYRRSDKSLVDKYLKKLKRDVYEVIRDIAAIHKVKGISNVPQDLKILIRAMKHYVRNQARLESEINKSNMKQTKSRRNFYKINKSNKESLVHELVNILKVIDKNMPVTNALAPLSATSKKIVKRVIKNNYLDEFSAVSLSVFDPKYNLTNDLRNIGTDWARMTDNVAQSTICDRLHAMKLLHLILSVDIIKMNDAMSLLDFAYNRRMVLVENGIGGEIVAKINKGLQAINEKIKVIIKLHQRNRQMFKKSIENTNKDQKESFLKKLKNILKTSKSDITSLLKRKVPKKEIVKQLAKKKLDELNTRRFMEFEETMRNWQNKLNLIPRDKRFARDVNYKNRMRNILPKYLRGKVNPAIDAKKSKKSSKKHKKQKPQAKSTTSTVKSNLTTTKSKLNGVS